MSDNLTVNEKTVNEKIQNQKTVKSAALHNECVTCATISHTSDFSMAPQDPDQRVYRLR